MPPKAQDRSRAMTDDSRIAILEREVEALRAIQAGITVVLASLIAKHHDHDQLQLHIATMLELTALQAPLNDRQRAVLRDYVESLQRLQPAGPIDPLATGWSEQSE
jgi:hypothetical protein